jgi:hypothetical protein
LHVSSTGPSRFCSPALVALRRLVFLNAGRRWWDARMGLPSPLIRASWSYNAARGTLLQDSFAVIDITVDNVSHILSRSSS